jgi:hypothetical protein
MFISDLQSKVKNGSGFFAEGQRSLPHPQLRKSDARAPSSKIDITHRLPPFNRDCAVHRAGRLLSQGSVAKRARIGASRKPAINQDRTEMPENKVQAHRLVALAGILVAALTIRVIAAAVAPARRPMLLIVPVLFFISPPRRGGRAVEGAPLLRA